MEFIIRFEKNVPGSLSVWSKCVFIDIDEKAIIYKFNGEQFNKCNSVEQLVDIMNTYFGENIKYIESVALTLSDTLITLVSKKIFDIFCDMVNKAYDKYKFFHTLSLNFKKCVDEYIYNIIFEMLSTIRIPKLEISEWGLGRCIIPKSKWFDKLHIESVELTDMDVFETKLFDLVMSTKNIKRLKFKTHDFERFINGYQKYFSYANRNTTLEELLVILHTNINGKLWKVDGILHQLTMLRDAIKARHYSVPKKINIDITQTRGTLIYPSHVFYPDTWFYRFLSKWNSHVEMCLPLSRIVYGLIKCEELINEIATLAQK
jgi:hypothetical protein